MIRKWDIKDKEVQKKCIAEVIQKIQEIDSSEVGIIAAQEVIDIVTNSFGPEIYNLAIGDVKKLLNDRFKDLELDVEMLEVRS